MQELHHVAKVSKATQWKPGVSGNPAGKPIGTRYAFSQVCPRFRARLTGRGIGPRALSRLLRKSARGCQGKQWSAQIFNYAGIDSRHHRGHRVRKYHLSRSVSPTIRAPSPNCAPGPLPSCGYAGAEDTVAIECLVCSTPFAARDDKFVFKYFLLRTANRKNGSWQRHALLADRQEPAG